MICGLLLIEEKKKIMQILFSYQQTSKLGIMKDCW